MLAFCEQFRKDDTHDYWKDGVYPFMVPARVEQDCTRYEVEMKQIREPIGAAPEPALLDGSRIQRIFEKNYPRQSVFEAEHFCGGGMIGKKDERKACVRVGLVADARSGFVFPPELGMPERATADIIANAVLNAIETAQCLPSEVRVSRHQFQVILEPVAKKLGAVVRTVKHLPALQQVKDEILAMMGDPGPFIG